MAGISSPVAETASATRSAGSSGWLAEVTVQFGLLARSGLRTDVSASRINVDTIGVRPAMANGTTVAVLSDIHIGDNSNTCWYQASVHEPYLVAALDFIADNAEMFQEVVLLGDLVDTWTYAPSVTPPTMADIIAKNPNVLGNERRARQSRQGRPEGHLPARKP